MSAFVFRARPLASAVLATALVAPFALGVREAGAQAAGGGTTPAGGTTGASPNGVAPARGNAAAGTLHAPLRAVDPGREDIGGISTSFRMEPLDLRLPTAFGRVYEVPGDEDDLLMRGNGALFAIFPRSTYRFDGNGPRPSVPAGTVFRIGMPGPSALDLKPPATPAQGAVDTRVLARPVNEPGEAAGTRAPRSTAQRAAEPAPVAAASSDARFPAANAADPYASLALGPSRVASRSSD